MSEGATSEKTPESGVRAIEDVRPADGTLARPSGQPTVLGPSNWNPFWSEGMRDEAILRAIRPSDLPPVPQDSPELLPGEPTGVSPPREGPEAFRAMIQSLVSENARLWSEREAFMSSSGEGRWSGPGQQWGQPPPWAMSMMSSMMEAMRMGMTSSSRPTDGGLLGPLMNDGGRRGCRQLGLPDPRNDYGDQLGHPGGPRTSLMEVFNRVSAAGGAFQSWLPSIKGSDGRDFEVEGSLGGTRGGPRHVGQVRGSQPQGRVESSTPGDPVSVEQSGNPAGGQPGDSSSGGGHHGGGSHGAGSPQDNSRPGQNGGSNGGNPGYGGFPGGGGDFPGGPPFGPGGGLPDGFHGGGLPGGFPGGFPGGGWPGGGRPGGGGNPGPPGGGGPGGGGDPGLNYAGFPAWLGGLMAQQESVRAVELPSLQELSESEIGPLIAGDWLTTIGPFLRDMSSSSSLWWDEVLNVAGTLYRIRLNSEPMERLRLVAVSPPAFHRPPWLRIEQRGSVALLKAIPESIRSELVSQREVSSVSIVYKILRVYQPGGLGERTTLLKQLVEQKVPSQLGDWLSSLRAWRRWLTRVQELGIQPPDPVLLLATLDRFAAGLAKLSSQVEFRLQVTRAALRIDVAPTDQGIQQFAESLLAEGEATFHGSANLPVKDSVKIRALDGDGGIAKEEGGKSRHTKDKLRDAADGKTSKDSKDPKNVKSDPKSAKGDQKASQGDKPVCRYFLSDAGCKKGQACSFPHEWKGVSKQGRCWSCGSSQHLKPDCPVKEVPRVKKEVPEEVKGKEISGAGGEGGAGQSSDSSSAMLFHPPTIQPSEDLMKEAVQLLKSLRPSIKAVSLSSVTPVKGATRALLDGGATHVLRPARSKSEYDRAIPIKVELAAGVTTLRQVAHSGTLITDFDTQIIVPLGKVVRLGYRVRWESDAFELLDPNGVKVEVELEAGCPTVDLSMAHRLISELEAHEEEMTRRVAALRAGNPGDLAPNVWKWLTDLREMWPEVPDELLARVIPTGRWSAESVPLNRRQRQRILSSSSVVLHLFSGPEQSWWKKHLDSSSRTVVCIDKMADSNQDLLSDHLASFLAEVCEKGTVDVILGGPPCRTVSKLRFRRPGPPPLRARKGPERFALNDLSDSMRELAWSDAVLWMRQLWLYTLASAARRRKVLFLKEHPRDPEEYKPSHDVNVYPSFYAWPEWEVFRDRYGLAEVRVDLGALGHERRKPTTLGTNILHLKCLDGLTDHQARQHLESSAPLADRTSQSRSWAAWPERFKEEIVKGILLQLDDPESGDREEDHVGLAKMTSDQWKAHVLQDHIPFSKECVTCLKGAGKSRPHRKVPHPDAMTLSLDVCGPFRPGEDFRKKSRYFLVGVYAIPVKKNAEGVIPLPQSMVEILGGLEEMPEDAPEEPLLPEVESEEVSVKEGDGRDLEEWERLEVEAEDVVIRNYTIVETLTSRNGTELKAGLARMIARLKYLGMEVRRVHSDGAGEMWGTRRWCEDRGIYRTFTSGSDWKGNGRAEAEVGVIRRSINTLIRASEDGEEKWPLMAKHVGERRGRLQLQALGFTTPMLLPWGRKVMVTTKGWDDFQGHWRLRKRQGVVRGPDHEMSLTSGGHIVEIDPGKFVRTNDMVQGELPPSLTDVLTLEERPEPADIRDNVVVPRRRLREKTSLSSLALWELQDRLRRGQEWANEEFARLESTHAGEKDSIAVVYDLDFENGMIEEMVKGGEVGCKKLEGEASKVADQDEEIFLQTKTISLQEVRKTLPLWIPSLKTEIENFDNNNAIQRISEEQTQTIIAEAQEKGQRAELIPGMGVFTRKAGDGRRRSRIVCCGNYMEARAGDEIYASGADSTQLRMILRVASLRQWHCLSLDVKSAFLLAPKAQGETVIVKPPRILEEAGLAQPGEHWLVSAAMYGLVTSPKDWSSFRDSELQKMLGSLDLADVDHGGEQGVRFGFRPMEDPNLWAIQEVRSDPSNEARCWGKSWAT